MTKTLILMLVATLTQAALAQGVTSDRILLGQAAVFSGPAAQLGIQMRNGIKAYFDHVNEKGGVHGRRLELISEDDFYEASRAPAASKKLIEEHRVFALLGYVGTPTGVVHLPVVTQAKVPLVGMFTGAEALRAPFNRYVFHVRASYYDETEAIVEQVDAKKELFRAADEALPSQGSVTIDGSEGATVQLATCCRPVPGDAIVGYLGRGEGLMVHTADCGVGRRQYGRDSESWITVEWAEAPVRPFETAVNVLVSNGKGVLAQVAAAVSGAEADIVHIDMGDAHATEATELRLLIAVRDRLHLADTLRALKRSPAVLRVARVKP